MFYSRFVIKSCICFLAHCLPWCLCVRVCDWGGGKEGQSVGNFLYWPLPWSWRAAEEGDWEEPCLGCTNITDMCVKDQVFHQLCLVLSVSGPVQPGSVQKVFPV